jgi:outer membrane protein assembly factor BamB
MVGGNELHTGSLSAKISPPLSLDWIAETKVLEDAAVSPVVADGRIYLACMDQVYCLDAVTGRQIWKQPSSGKLNSPVNITPAVGEKYLYLSKLDGEVLALSLADGAPGWSYKAKKSNRRSAPVVVGDVIFFGSTDNRLYALDAETGQPVWETQPELTDDIVSSPTVTDDLVLVMTSDGYVYAVNRLNGQPRWKTQLLQPPTGAAPIVMGDTVITVAGNSVFGLELRSGNPRWEVALGERLTAGPVVADNTVYVGDRKQNLYAISIAGRKLWEQKLDGVVCANPVALNGQVVAPTSNGMIYGFSPTGKLIWQYQVEPAKNPDRFYGGCAALDDKLYILSSLGHIYCFVSGAYDATGPEIVGTLPKVLSRINGMPPVAISGRVTDYGSGVNPESIKVWLDDKPVTTNFNIETNRFRYETPVTQPVTPLGDGTHQVKVQAADWAGNVSELVWSFTVDNKLPRDSRRSGN